MKTIYLIRGLVSETYKGFSDRILTSLHNIKNDYNPHSLKITITTESPPLISVIPFQKKKLAAISVQNESKKINTILTSLQGFSGSYVVEEALPVAYNKNWSDGQATPGIGLLTLFRKKKSIDYETFIKRWHNGHTPLSIELHPLWNYVRNVVKEKLTDNALDYDGIVEEHVKTRQDLLNPFKFFNGYISVFLNMIKVYIDVISFIDYSSIETYLITEYILIS